MHDVCSPTNQLEQRGSLKRQARFVLQSMIFLLHRFQAPFPPGLLKGPVGPDSLTQPGGSENGGCQP